MTPLVSPSRGVGTAMLIFLMLLAGGTHKGLADEKGDISVGICQSTAQGPAKFAIALLNGARLSIDDFNAKGGAGGRKIQILPLDIGDNDPAQARLSFSKAIEVNKIVALLCWGTNVMTQNTPVIDQGGVAAFTMSQGINVYKNAKLIQQLEAVTTLQCRSAAKYTKERYPQVKRLAMLYVNYEYGVEMRDQCKSEFGKIGVDLVASEAHPNSATDLRAQMTKLLEMKPDAIYLAAIGGGSIPVGIRAGRELGYEGVFMTSSAGDTPDVYKFKLAEQDFFFDAHTVRENTAQDIKDAVTKYGGYVGAGYDFGWLIGQYSKRLVDVGKSVNGTGIISALRADGKVSTPVNDYVFKTDGDTIRALGIFGVENGVRKPLKEYSAAELQN